MKNAPDKDDQEDGRVTFYGALFLFFLLMGCIAAYAIATTHP